VLEKHDGFQPMELYPAYTGKQMIFPSLRETLTAVKRTSLTRSIISLLAGRGLPILVSQAGRPCKSSLTDVTVGASLC